MSAARFIAPLAWTGVIAWFSADSWGGPGTGGLLLPLMHGLLPWATPEQLEALHWLVRKGAHVTEYGVLAMLWRWALGPPVWPRSLIALGLCALTASLDEWHQTTTQTRTGSPIDVLLDTSAAGAALVLLAYRGAAVDRLIGALLWTAAIGGAALVAINWAVAAPEPWLWISVPAAWVALFLWRRRIGRG